MADGGNRRTELISGSWPTAPPRRVGPSAPDSSAAGPSWWVRWAVPVAAGSESCDLACRQIACRNQRRRPRADAYGRAARAPGVAARLVPAQSRPPSRCAGPAHRFPARPGRRGLRRAAAQPGTRSQPARPGPVSGRARASWTRNCAAGSCGCYPTPRSCPAAEPAGRRVRPRDAVVLDASMPGLADSIASVLPDLVAGPARHPAFAVLGVRRLGLAELADMLASLDREPAWWRHLYDVLAPQSQPARRARAHCLCR